MRISLLLVLSLLFHLVPVSDAEAKGAKQKRSTSLSAQAKAKQHRNPLYVPRGTQLKNTVWANQYGNGHKSISDLGSGKLLRTTLTTYKDGTVRSKSVNEATGNRTSTFQRGGVDVTMLRESNGAWERKRVTKSGLIHITSSKLQGSKILSYEVPASIGKVAALRLARKLASQKNKTVRLSFSDGSLELVKAKK